MMHLIPQDNQPRLPTPAVKVNDQFHLHLPTNKRLQRGFRAIMHNFRIDLAITLKDVKDKGFPISSSAPFLLHPLRAKEIFVDFYRACKGRKLYILLRDAGLDIRLQEYAHDEHTDFPTMLYNALGIK